MGIRSVRQDVALPGRRKGAPIRTVWQAAKSSVFESAVSRNRIVQTAAKLLSTAPYADNKSAIQQIANLRYGF
jgi:hypothetical protein